MKKNNELTIKELTKYYVDRYNLHLKPDTEVDDPYQKYSAEITRILKSIKFGQTSLWEAIKTDGKSREIAIDEFEKYCFQQWVNYLKDKHKWKFNIELLNEDEARIKKSNDELYWKQKTDEYEQRELDYIIEQAEMREHGIEDTNFYLDINEFENKKQRMMLEAIYYALYRSFDDEALKEDLTVYTNGEETAKALEAQHKLEDYSNYIGEIRPEIVKILKTVSKGKNA